MKLLASYKGMWKALSRYWTDYGGWQDFLISPLLHFSVAVSASSYAVWLKPTWIDLPLSLLPNLLGFSLGAYALIFSLADERLLAALDTPPKNGGPTHLRMINATFLHFILVQTAAIIFALSNKSTAITDLVSALPLEARRILTIQIVFGAIAGFVGHLLTVYAVVLLVGAALAAYRLAVMSGRAATLSQQAQARANETSSTI